MKQLLFSFLLAIFFLQFWGDEKSSAEGRLPSPQIQLQSSFQAWNSLPILDSGRLKPFSTFSREMVAFVTGQTHFQRWNSTELLLSWLSDPQAWEGVPFIRIGDDSLRRSLGLLEKRFLYSPGELIQNAQVIQAFHGGGQTQPKNSEKELLFQRLAIFRGLSAGMLWSLIPQAQGQPWLSLMQEPKDRDQRESIQEIMVGLMSAYRLGDALLFQRFTLLLKDAVEARLHREQPELSIERLSLQLRAESFYDQFHPFSWAWLFYSLAVFAWIFASFRRVRLLAFFFTLMGFFSHSLGFFLRCFVAGRPPVTNMYESVLWVSFGILLFGAFFYFLIKKNSVMILTCLLAAISLIITDLSPTILDPSIRPLMPVLRSNYWLTVHVLTITLSYAAFALTFGLAHLALFLFLRKKCWDQALELNQWVYRTMQLGVILIAAGTLLGGVWADYSWGRFWGWDPKEVWALITLLCYVALLHGRYTSWMSPFVFSFGAVLSFLAVIMAWYGVNFILGAGLHSYGFSTGGQGWVALFVGLQLFYLLGIFYYYRKNASLLCQSH